MAEDVFARRVSEEYAKWLVFVSGKDEMVDVPFFPVASFDREMLADFVSELVTRTIGPDFNMLSVITEKGKPVFMLVERVEKGRFVSVKVLKADTGLEETKKEHGVNITKSVERSVLEDVFSLQDKYRNTKDKRTYILDLTVILANALKDGTLYFEPEPPVVKAIRGAIRRVKVDLKLLMGLRDYLASIEMKSGRKALLLDLGTPFRLVIQKEHLFGLLSGLEKAESLAGILDAVSEWLAAGFKSDAVRIEPGSFIWRGLERLIEHDARTAGNKMKFMLSMFADPLFLLLLVGEESYVLEFRKGVISGIERVDVKGTSLKEAWLDLSRRRTYMHLAIKVDPKVLTEAMSPMHLPVVLKRGYELYPKNEFVEHLNNMGAINLFMRLVYPFVKS